MSNNFKPDSNHFDDFMDEEEKNEIEDDENEVEDEEVYTDTDFSEEDEEVSDSSRISKEIYKAKMIKLLGLAIVILLIVILIGYIMSLFNKKSYSYNDVEDIMRDSAISYFQDNKKNLPVSNKNDVEISDAVLTEEGYMKPLGKLINNDSCSGKVVVKKIASKEYKYTSYLNCGDNYKTREFYKELLSTKNIVNSGYGLYKINNEYVYRGKNVNNYVKFSDSDLLWRIVKITSNNEIVLIQADRTVNSYVWDERYNSAIEDTSGINVFDKSHISTVLKVLYKGYYGNPDSDNYYEKYGEYQDEVKILTKKDKEKVKTHKACVGLRSVDDTSRDGSSECQVTADLKFSLLPVYDFMNASIDPGCKTTTSPECQNYNYLVEKSGFWLANGDNSNSSYVYYVTGTEFIRNVDAANDSYIR